MANKVSVAMPMVDASMLLKAFVVLFILFSPLLSYSKVQFLNATWIKVAILLAIVAVCFVDFLLAVLLTIAFLILVLNLNHVTLSKARDTFMNNKSNDTYIPPAEEDRIPNESLGADKNLVCGNVVKNDINADLLSHYIDDKIKPYEVFIRMMADDSKLQDAADGWFAV